MQRKDREVLEARLKEVAAIYDNGGLSALRNWVQRSRDRTGQILFRPPGRTTRQ